MLLRDRKRRNSLGAIGLPGEAGQGGGVCDRMGWEAGGQSMGMGPVPPTCEQTGVKTSPSASSGMRSVKM